jgi:repressor LexA
MRDASILDGDLVVVRSQETARAGEIVAARVGEEATVKRFSREGDVIVLLPENDAYEPIRIEPGAEEVQILGKVVGVYRRV